MGHGESQFAILGDSRHVYFKAHVRQKQESARKGGREKDKEKAKEKERRTERRLRGIISCEGAQEK